MKNKAGFYTKSQACKLAEEEGKLKISFRCPETFAKELGVEWHHGGSGIIAFFPKNKDETAKINDLKDKIKNLSLKSKKDCWQYLEGHDAVDGNFKIYAKLGKYGYFKIDNGEFDRCFKIKDETIYKLILDILN